MSATVDVSTAIPLDRLGLGNISRVGYRTGLLIKLGAFVKSWKSRYFSLTWNCLSYFDPDDFLFISNIPFCDCKKVTIADSDGSDNYAFTLVTTTRTFVFVSNNKQDRQMWVEALDAMISLHRSITAITNSTSPNKVDKERLEVLKLIAFHVFRILHGIVILNNTNKVLKEIRERMSSSFFELVKCFAESTEDKSEVMRRNRDSELQARSLSLRIAIGLLKEEIPAEHRIQPEEKQFDIALEQNRINYLLRKLSSSRREKTLTRSHSNPGSSNTSYIPPLMFGNPLQDNQNSLITLDEDTVQPFMLNIILQSTSSQNINSFSC
eukprot:TRINITY_DN6941_c0_g1_i1.p1 TRINITY_DN6941_c0_g1~~TRINITY_DN6941_c0_g1_i1.p1  ORF type:complete len:335 (+),score=68.81 TRINITY_DN6941_c0_g1_i1:39-1007(+)